MLKRSFTEREKVMLVILAVMLLGVFYYYLVWQPTSNAISAADARRLNAEDEILTEQTKLADYNNMEDTIKQYQSQPQSKTFPDYDNIQNVMTELNTILSSTDSYDLSFADVVFEDNVAKRTITMNYSCSSYSAAREIVDKLNASTYSCTIGAMTFSADGDAADLSSGKVSVNLTVTFYESAVGMGVSDDTATGTTATDTTTAAS